MCPKTRLIKIMLETQNGDKNQNGAYFTGFLTSSVFPELYFGDSNELTLLALEGFYFPLRINSWHTNLKKYKFQTHH